MRPLAAGSTIRVVLDFFRDVELSNHAFWAQTQAQSDAIESAGQPTWIIPLKDDGSERANELHGRWIADLNPTTRQIKVVTTGNRDRWRWAESTPDGFSAEYDTGTLLLEGHDIGTVFTYLDATELLRSIDVLPLPGRSTQTIELTDREQMRTTVRALSLPEGATRLQLTVSPETMSITRVVRFIHERVCETVSVELPPAP